MPQFTGLATGIGSLPFKQAAEAVDLVFRHLSRIPFWPQLPARGPGEGMVAQFAQGLPCLEVTEKGVSFDPAKKDEELEAFYAKILKTDAVHQDFAITKDFAPGLYAFKERLKTSFQQVEYIKCHITGPFTVAASINDENGNALLHDPVFMQAIVEGLLRKALWQIEFFREFSKPVIIFIDEPYLGCFGSAFTAVNREDVVSVLSDLTRRIKAPGSIFTGVHCCGNTDWSILTDIPTIDIINFDAFSYLDKFLLYARDLAGFFAAGRTVCWGVVPTQEFSGRETAASLAARLESAMATLTAKGINRDVLASQMLISPSCGLGSLETAKAKAIFQLLEQTSSLIQAKG